MTFFNVFNQIVVFCRGMDKNEITLYEKKEKNDTRSNTININNAAGVAN